MKVELNFKNLLIGIGIIFILLVITSAISGYLYGVSVTEKKIAPDTWNPNFNLSPFEVKFYKGVEAYNQGGDLLFESFNLSQNPLSHSASIAKAEVAKGFYDDAKFSFSSSLSEKSTDKQLRRADYLSKSADYYSRGIDEYTTAYRMFENKNQITSNNIVQAGVSLVKGQSPDFSKFNEDPEVKIKLEKARTYFDLARDYGGKANNY